MEKNKELYKLLDNLEKDYNDRLNLVLDPELKKHTQELLVTIQQIKNLVNQFEKEQNPEILDDAIQMVFVTIFKDLYT